MGINTGFKLRVFLTVFPFGIEFIFERIITISLNWTEK